MKRQVPPCNSKRGIGDCPGCGCFLCRVEATAADLRAVYIVLHQQRQTGSDLLCPVTANSINLGVISSVLEQYNLISNNRNSFGGCTYHRGTAQNEPEATRVILQHHTLEAASFIRRKHTLTSPSPSYPPGTAQTNHTDRTQEQYTPTCRPPMASWNRSVMVP